MDISVLVSRQYIVIYQIFKKIILYIYEHFYSQLTETWVWFSSQRTDRKVGAVWKLEKHLWKIKLVIQAAVMQVLFWPVHAQTWPSRLPFLSPPSPTPMEDLMSSGHGSVPKCMDLGKGVTAILTIYSVGTEHTLFKVISSTLERWVLILLNCFKKNKTKSPLWQSRFCRYTSPL